MEKGNEPCLASLKVKSSRKQYNVFTLLSVFAAVTLFWSFASTNLSIQQTTRRPLRADQLVARCKSLKRAAGPPDEFSEREQSDRFVEGTKPFLIRNAKVWTGDRNGTSVVKGDILLDKGMIRDLGRISPLLIRQYGRSLVEVDVNGSWVTPGIVDVHSHLGVGSSPELDGASDTNSLKGTAQPWLRSVDGLNTHDESYHLSISGGVTTALVLPGSANAIGGQAFVIKLRKTAEKTPTSMVLEAPLTLNTSYPDSESAVPWRHMKHACGENPSRVYSDTRMDTLWHYRESYNTARLLKNKQDQFCSKVLSNDWDDLVEFPEDLQWEALVDVLRGRVKVNVHCYESVDLDNLVRLSNEFKFPIAAFHHAHETYLVPDLLKKAYGCCYVVRIAYKLILREGAPPAIAMFATNARYKREAYRGSEFAARILASNDLNVIMKSDHPVLNSRFLLYEAQQAHYYGLPANLALASVISTPATVMGMSHRIGFIREGYDADIAIWDSHPLSLGATPTQVFIDGIPQVELPFSVSKPEEFQKLPKTPDFDKEADAAIKYDGLPPLAPAKSSGAVLFVNVANYFSRTSNGIKAESLADNSVVLARNGSVICSGSETACAGLAHSAVVVDLEGGAISPGLVSYGAPLGLEHITAESSTIDGSVYDPLIQSVPSILGGATSIVRAVDGLQYGTRDALLALRYSGVTTAITAPSHSGFFSGLGTCFALSSSHKLETGAVVQDVTAVHVSVRHFGVTPSVSTQIAALRRLLVGPYDGESGQWFNEIAEGKVTLVVDTSSADIIATLISLKNEVETLKGNTIKMSITGATEAHIVAEELGKAQIGVVVSPSRPFPFSWEDRRTEPGLPLSEDSAVVILLKHNVTVGIGILETWEARNLNFDIGWLALDAGGAITKEQAIALGSVNVEKLLGAEVEAESADLVAWRGGEMFDFSAKPVGVISPRRGVVELL